MKSVSMNSKLFKVLSTGANAPFTKIRFYKVV